MLESGKIVVTGGAGFIGSNFLKMMIEKYPHKEFVNVDVLTYAGNIENLRDLEDSSNYRFIKGDICDRTLMEKIISKGDIVINFAAESHVDNSINSAAEFIRTNVLGTQCLLDVSREKEVNLFVQISTDEVYGSLDFDQVSSKEGDLLIPSSPYSASKAAAEMLCIAAFKTFKFPVIITRSSNNFGPYQFPEKVIPLFVTNLIEGKSVPLYGEGKNVRDWIYVLDNCDAIDFVMKNGKPGEIYNIGGGNELKNIELTDIILNELEKDSSFIERVPDRKGHDLRYSLDCTKVHSLGWRPKFSFSEALKETINWYKQNSDWWKPLKKIEGKRTS